MTRVGLASLLLLASSAVASPGRARAQPATDREAPEAQAPACPAPCSTVDGLAASLSRQTAAALARTGGRIGDVVVISRSALPASAPRGDELVEALVGPTVAAVAALPGVSRVDRAADAARDVDDLAEAVSTATRAGHERLVVVHVGLDGNYVVVQARIVTTEHRWWRRRGTPAGTRIGAPFVRARLDVELRGYVGMLPPVEGARVSARALSLPGSGYLAVEVLDLDGDERNEVVLLRPDALEVLRLAGRLATARALTIVARAPLDALGRSASVRRRAIGTLAATADARGTRVVGRTSEQARGFEARWVDARLEVAADPADGYPLGGCGGARLVPGRDVFDPGLTSRCAGLPAPGPATAPFYARATLPLRTASATEVAIDATSTADGTLRLRVGAAPPVSLPDAGAAVAMADVNDDGELELLSSSSADVGTHDRLTLRIVRPTGEHRVSWSSAELAGSVLVAGRGDVDSDGLVELLAIEEPPPGAARPSRLWVVR